MNRPPPLLKIQTNCAPLRSFFPVTALIVAAMALLVGCKPANEPDSAATAAEEEAELNCGHGGRLSTELYGAVEATLDWRANDLECTGMPRPEGQGIRLRFAGATGDDDLRIAVIIAIPEFDRNVVSDEFSSNVTLIEEGNGRFFSTSNLNNCLADIALVEALDDSGDRFAVSGEMFCVSPLPEVNGDSSVSISEMLFSGLLDWSAS
jgi:hypothetical protein